MKNNDILRRLRYALDLNDAALVEIFKISGRDLTLGDVTDILKKEEEPGYRPCNDALMAQFLNGFITLKRGPKDESGTPPPEKTLTNNDILKKIRVALNLKENDMLEIFRISGNEISRPELSALFRREGHKHYRPCGDQILRHFLKGLTLRLRG